MKNMKSILVVLAFFAITSSAAAQSVQVLVSTAQVSGKTVYRYRVVNNSTQRIVSVQIGYDYPHGVYALNVTPSGWSRANGLPSSSVTSPSGWTPSLLTSEETETENSLDWRSDVAGNDILPGQTKGGFSVTVDGPAAAYSSGIWTTIFGDTSPTSADLAASGRVLPDSNPDVDTTPPSISVTLTPAIIWPPNHKMTTVTAHVQVSDDRDPNPQVRLVSITSNEGDASDVADAAFGTDDREFSVRADRTGQQKQGRVYTVKYSATDASGNVAYATATVTIPHDQRH